MVCGLIAGFSGLIILVNPFTVKSDRVGVGIISLTLINILGLLVHYLTNIKVSEKQFFA